MESDSNDVPTLDYGGYEKPPPSSRWIIWLILGGFCFLLFIIWSMQPHLVSRPTGNRVKSASNLRQIGQAILLYTNDFHGVYPDSFGPLLMNEDITSGVFVSPRRNESPAMGPTTQAVIDQMNAGGHVSYVYLGAGLTVNTVTPDTIVAYEMLDNPDTGCNVLFGDGHVEWGNPPSSSQIDAAAKSGKRPVTMPSPLP